MPPPPAPQLSASLSGEGMTDSGNPDKQSLTTPLAGTIGSGKLNGISEANRNYVFHKY